MPAVRPLPDEHQLHHIGASVPIFALQSSIIASLRDRTSCSKLRSLKIVLFIQGNDLRSIYQKLC